MTSTVAAAADPRSTRSRRRVRAQPTRFDLEAHAFRLRAVPAVFLAGLFLVEWGLLALAN